MITLKDWRLDVPCTQGPIGYDRENLASRVAICTDAGPEWTCYLHMRYSDGTTLPLPLSWRDGVLWGELTRPYVSVPGPVQVTVQGRNGPMVKKSNIGILYVGKAVEAGGAGPELSVGVPRGGTAGQLLSKASGDDFDTVWIDAPNGAKIAADAEVTEMLDEVLGPRGTI